MDSRSHQAVREQGAEVTSYRLPLSGPGRTRAGKWKGKRLTGLRDGIAAAGHEFHIADLATDDWSDAAVLIVAGRNDSVTFSDAELARIADFSRRGGGMLLMANHPRKFVAPQNLVCEALGLPVSFEMRNGSRGRCVLRAHETSDGCDAVQIRTSCALAVQSSPLATVLAVSPVWNEEILAVAVESNEQHGRVVAMGSAGHIASLDDSGADLFASASNARWTLSLLRWLGMDPSSQTPSSE